MNILLTGATGYIGRRLKFKLLQDEQNSITLFVRHPESLSDINIARCTIIKGDTFNTEALSKAMEGIDVAYYLIHSLGKEDYASLDRISAENFRIAAIKAGVKKIVYLGGLGLKNEQTSQHLLSRIETGETLSIEPEKIDVIWFRAGVIIGSGSASFEIIRNLIEKLPIMITPKWVRTMAQPIGVEDVITYLDEAKDPKIEGTHVVDIGSEQMCYQSMMQETSKALGLKRYIIPVPFLSIGLSSYWLNLFTPVPFSVAHSLIEGLKSEVTIQNSNAQKLFSAIKPITFHNAVKHAIVEAEENQVISRWSDKGGDVWEMNHHDSIADAVFMDRQRISLNNLDQQQVFETILSIGGDNGWFSYDWLWEIRGLMDKAFGGVGLKRGRRSQNTLRIGDSLDFWKVVDLKENERLLLFAQMIVPGKAWLEFKLVNGELIQSAYFIPKGVLGRLYWYMLIPIHFLVFKDMIRSIIKRSSNKAE